MNPFEGDICLRYDYNQIVEKYQPELLIETGTHLGNTTEFMATLNIPVLAIEKNPEFFKITSDKVKQHSHVQVLLGDSAQVLESLYDTLKTKKILAFLDAHWGGGYTLERELEFAAKLPIKPFLIIHDIQNPTHPEFGYDSHDNHAYTFQYFQPYIEKIYQGNYRHCFNNENTPAGTQGVLFLNPTQ